MLDLIDEAYLASQPVSVVEGTSVRLGKVSDDEDGQWNSSAMEMQSWRRVCGVVLFSMAL